MVPSIIHLEGFDWTRRMTPWMLLSPAFNCTTPDSNGVSEEKDFNMSCGGIPCPWVLKQPCYYFQRCRHDAVQHALSSVITDAWL